MNFGREKKFNHTNCPDFENLPSHKNHSVGGGQGWWGGGWGGQVGSQAGW